MTRSAQPPPPSRTPVEGVALAGALRLFVAAFVIDDKREQVHRRLLAAGRRAETLATLPRWLGARTEALAGRDLAPSGLRARFGDLAGIHLLEDGAARTTIAGALQHGRGRASLFVADTGRLALLTAADGPPLLISA